MKMKISLIRDRVRIILCLSVFLRKSSDCEINRAGHCRRLPEHTIVIVSLQRALYYSMIFFDLSISGEEVMQTYQNEELYSVHAAPVLKCLSEAA